MGHSIITKKTDNLQFSYVLLGGGGWGVYREKKAGIGLSIRFSGGGGRRRGWEREGERKK